MHKYHTVLAISSIAIGLFVIGTLLGMMDLQLSYMDKAHQASQPSHISLMLRRDVDFSVAESIKNMDEVNSVDIMTQFTGQFKTSESSPWQTGTLLFRTDYINQKQDQMRLLAGSFPHDKFVAIERLSAKYTHLSLGDTLEIKTPNGTEILTIAGIIRHPFVKPPSFGGQLHVFIAPELAPTFNIPSASFRQLLVQVKPPYNPGKVNLIAGEIRQKLASQNIPVNATLLQNPDQHWGRAIFKGIHLILTVMAWASLALSSVLILNTVAALITQQTDQIGIMKSLGARRSSIAKIYLSEVFVLSIIALLIAIPLSAAGAYYSSRWLLDLFNIELSGFVYSPKTIYIMIAGGLIAPILAALQPILQGASLSVRYAISSYRLGADFVSTRFDRWLELKIAACLPTIYAIAIANLLRRKARLLWTQSVLIIAGVLFIVITSLIASLNLTLNNELDRSSYDIRLGFIQDQPQEIINKLVNSVPNTQSIELWNRMPVELSVKDKVIQQVGSLGMQMIALPTNTSMYKPLIVEGRWFDNSDEQQQHLVINADTAALNGIHVGDKINTKLLQHTAQEWEVIGLYRWFAGTGYTVEPIYGPLSTLQTNTKNEFKYSFALLTARLNSLNEEKTYLEALKTVFQEHPIVLDVYTTIAKREQRQFAENQFKPMLGMLLGLTIMIAIVGGIGLSGTLAISVLQRTREIAVLRAIGANSTTIFRLFMLEGLLHGLLAWLISVPTAYLVAAPLAKKLGLTLLGMHLDFVFSQLSVLIWLVVVCILAIFATYLPARNATKIVVRAGLNY
ncbi:MAG: FtsX-like permease family protein [Methylococcales bacterium]|nr:FtsX-like permease family protein [Methylococcales bacterium]